MTNSPGTDPKSAPTGLGSPGNQGPDFAAPGAPAQPDMPNAQPGANNAVGPNQVGAAANGQVPQQPYGQVPQQNPYGQGPQQNPYGQGPQQAAYGQVPQPPYGQPTQQVPYGQAPQQPYYQTPQPPRPVQPNRKRNAIIAAVGVVVLALLAAVVYGVYKLSSLAGSQPATQPTPTRPVATAPVATTPAAPASAATGPAATRTIAVNPGGASATVQPSSAGETPVNCNGGDTITTAAFTATVPKGWSCDGREGDISIATPKNDTIWIAHDNDLGDVAGACKYQADDLVAVSALPKQNWGGKTAIGYQGLDVSDIVGLHCVVSNHQTWYFFYSPYGAANLEAVRADVASIMSSWVWK